MSQILTTKEYGEVIMVNSLKTRGYDSDFEHLETMFENCTYWVDDSKLIGMNHLLTKILEQFEKNGHNLKDVLDWVYGLKESHNFEISEGGHKFTDSFLDYCTNYASDFEEKLIKAQQLLR